MVVWGTFVCFPQTQGQYWDISVLQGGTEAHGKVMTCLGLWKRGGEPCTASLVPSPISRRLFRAGMNVFPKTTDAGPSQVKTGMTVGLDPCRGSGVGAWSGVSLGQALPLLTGMLTPGASSSHCTAVVRVVDL